MTVWFNDRQGVVTRLSGPRCVQLSNYLETSPDHHKARAKCICYACTLYSYIMFHTFKWNKKYRYCKEYLSKQLPGDVPWWPQGWALMEPTMVFNCKCLSWRQQCHRSCRQMVRAGCHALEETSIWNMLNCADSTQTRGPRTRGPNQP